MTWIGLASEMARGYIDTMSIPIASKKGVGTSFSSLFPKLPADQGYARGIAVQRFLIDIWTPLWLHKKPSAGGRTGHFEESQTEFPSEIKSTWTRQVAVANELRSRPGSNGIIAMNHNFFLRVEERPSPILFVSGLVQDLTVQGKPRLNVQPPREPSTNTALKLRGSPSQCTLGLAEFLTRKLDSFPSPEANSVKGSVWPAVK